MAVFAVITGMGGLLGDVSSLVMAAGLGALGWNELRGAKLLGRFEAQGARVLGYNQLMLGVVIIAYAAWSMFAALHVKPESSGSAEVDEMMREYTGVVTYALYGTMALVGVVVPGFTALYYFSRAKLVRNLHATTPAWVIDALRAAA